jgi:hypothetical protein
MPERAHETSEVGVRGIGWTALGLAVTLAAIVLGTRVVLRPREPERPRAPATIDVPPPPRLEEDPAAERLRVRAREESLLNSYGWVDRPHGVVRIPIERAMDRIAAHGEVP